MCATPSPALSPSGGEENERDFGAMLLETLLPLGKVDPGLRAP